MLEPLPSENFKIGRLEVKYLFPISSSSDANFFIHQLSQHESGHEKNINTCYQNAKESTYQNTNFLNFHGLS